MILPYYQPDNNIIKIHLKIIPNSSKNDICGLINDGRQQMLKLKVTTLPNEGKANKAVIKLLAKHWDISTSDIEIISGQTSQKKRIAVTNTAQLLSKLEIYYNLSSE